MSPNKLCNAIFSQQVYMLETFPSPAVYSEHSTATMEQWQTVS